MTRRRILFRTDGGHAQGMGDVCGSLAIAQAFRSSGADVSFIVGGDAEARALVVKDGYPVLTIGPDEPGYQVELDLIQQQTPDAIVINRLNNPPGYIRSLKALCTLVVALDDTGPEAYVADINVNVLYQADGAISDVKFIALREEFQRYHKLERTIPELAASILVTQGGSDTYGFLPKIVTELRSVPGDLSITVVTGWSFRHFTELEEALHGDPRFRVVHGAENMAELMLANDLAITAGGNTVFELACLGTPSVVVCAEEFEVETADRLAADGVVVNLGFGGRIEQETLTRAVGSLIAAPDTRRRMSARGKAMVDGQGARRITRMILDKLAQESAN